MKTSQSDFFPRCMQKLTGISDWFHDRQPDEHDCTLEILFIFHSALPTTWHGIQKGNFPLSIFFRERSPCRSENPNCERFSSEQRRPSLECCKAARRQCWQKMKFCEISRQLVIGRLSDMLSWQQTDGLWTSSVIESAEEYKSGQKAIWIISHTASSAREISEQKRQNLRSNWSGLEAEREKSGFTFEIFVQRRESVNVKSAAILAILDLCEFVQCK